MFKNIETGEVMYPILGYDDYAISRSGVVGKSHRLRGNRDKYQKYTIIKPYTNMQTPFVTLYNGDKYENLSVAMLNLYSMYGELPFSIKYHDGNNQNVKSKNLTYEFNYCKIIDGINIDDTYISGKILILSDDRNRYEIFKPIPDEYIFTNFRYWISRKGVIYDYKKKCLVLQHITNDGYYNVKLYIPSRIVDNRQILSFRATLITHTLVYVSWVDTNLDGMTIDHIDGRSYNNNVTNLEKITIQENIRRAHDRNLGDDLIISAKWSTTQVHIVCKMLEERKTYKEIAEALGVDADIKNKWYKSVSNLCMGIRRGNIFKDISKEYDIINIKDPYYQNKFHESRRKYDKELIYKICEGLVEGKGATELNRIYPNIPISTIQGIKVGNQYKDIALSVPGMDKVINSRIKHFKNSKIREMNYNIEEE